MGSALGKSSPKAPAAPDYTSAAIATAQGNQESARTTADANRVNQYTPYGSLVYSHDPNAATPDQGWSATQTLSPDQQKLLDSTNNLNNGLMDTANSGLQYANSVLSQPGVKGWDVQKPGSFGANMAMPGDFKEGNPTTGFNPGQSYQDAMMARLSPQIDRENAGLDTQLANQGIMQGSEAYNNAKTLLGQQHNDLLGSVTTQGFNTGLAANNQAYGQNQAQYNAQLGANNQNFNQNQSAYNTGLNANQAGFQNAAYNQMQPINLINSLRTGSQVQNPSYVNVPQQANVAGADLLGAQQGNYNAQMGQYNAALGQNNAINKGLFSLGSSAISAYPW